jgi:hypothetical protein
MCHATERETPTITARLHTRSFALVNDTWENMGGQPQPRKYSVAPAFWQRKDVYTCTYSYLLVVRTAGSSTTSPSGARRL